MKLPTLENSKSFQQWWQANGANWVEQLCKTMIKHRNIGHDWYFTNEQKQQMEYYYDATKFLVDLMNIEGAVSKEVRVEIENSLLLPWTEFSLR